MRARAQKNRWEEELPRTEKEMVWTTLYFMHHRDTWYRRLCDIPVSMMDSDIIPGCIAYCQEKISQWEELARIADIQFRRSNSNFPATWVPLIPRH